MNLQGARVGWVRRRKAEGAERRGTDAKSGGSRFSPIWCSTRRPLGSKCFLRPIHMGHLMSGLSLGL